MCAGGCSCICPSSVFSCVFIFFEKNTRGVFKWHLICNILWNTQSIFPYFSNHFDEDADSSFLFSLQLFLSRLHQQTGYEMTFVSGKKSYDEIRHPIKVDIVFKLNKGPFKSYTFLVVMRFIDSKEKAENWCFFGGVDVHLEFFDCKEIQTVHPKELEPHWSWSIWKANWRFWPISDAKNWLIEKHLWCRENWRVVSDDSRWDGWMAITQPNGAMEPGCNKAGSWWWDCGSAAEPYPVRSQTRPKERPNWTELNDFQILALVVYACFVEWFCEDLQSL